MRPTDEHMRLMVKRLLAERFSLKAHMESKELPRYSLVKARNDGRLGETLRPSNVDCPAVIAARGSEYRLPVGLLQPGESPRCVTMTRATACSVTYFHEGMPMSQFVRTIQGQAGRVIVDKTGLTGTFDIQLEVAWPTLSAPVPSRQPATTQCDARSLFAALEEQLGLKLESNLGPVDVLVIDSVELPTPD